MLSSKMNWVYIWALDGARPAVSLLLTNFFLTQRVYQFGIDLLI